MGKRRKSGTLPGMSARGRTTPLWLFSVHLALVFVCAAGTAWAFDQGGQYRMLGYTFAMLWLAALILTALDDVRIEWLSWLKVRVLVALDAVRTLGNTRNSPRRD